MKDNRKIHNRRSIRLKGYDYSQIGAYFVTICTHNREFLFGNISDSKMILNDYGKIVEQCWYESPIQLQRRKMLLPKIIGRFKMNTAKQINIIRNTPGIPVWQRNYYEHIIRDDESFYRISKYIINNPINWEKDDYYA